MSDEKADLVNLETFLVYLLVEKPESLQSAFSTGMNANLIENKDISGEMIKKGEISGRFHNQISTPPAYWSAK